MTVFVIMVFSLFVLLWGGGGLIYLLRKHSIMKPFSKEQQEFLDFCTEMSKNALPPSAINKNSQSGFLWFS
ncbi:MAG: hypothetical protein FWF72_03670 [Paludibacter sp.]|nr:hypothetical protein [Paludibacter sp.]